VPIAGQNGNAAQVNVYDASGNFKYALTPFGADWKGTISVGAGDVTGDGVQDIVVGAGSGGGPRVVVFDGVSGNAIASFYAFDPEFTGGVNVAAGDTTGDGHADIIVGAGSGGGPVVKVFDGVTRKNIRSFYAFDQSSRNGVFVAAADLNNSGTAQIVTGSGRGSSPEVRVYGASDSDTLSDFHPYSANFLTGAQVGTQKRSDGRLVIVTAVDTMYQLPVLEFDINGNVVT
jgi:hypothetical protein